MKTIRLQSNDKEIFDVDVSIARFSGLIENIIQGCDMGENDDENNEKNVIPLANISSAILRKVLQWVDHHATEEVEERNKNHTEISAWDAAFLKMEQRMLMETILAANYLDIKGLLDVACLFVANMIKGKTPQQIKNTFRRPDVPGFINILVASTSGTINNSVASTINNQDASTSAVEKMQN